MYVDPDWSQPIDFEERLAAIPREAVVRGMFLQLLVDSIDPEQLAKLPKRRYLAFKNYPVREYVELLLTVSQCRRSKSPADCVRRLGWRVYPSYSKTISGTAIFAVAGRDFRRVIELSPAAYKVGMSPGSVQIRSLDAQHARVELRQIYNLPDLHQVGIWEGAMQTCGVEGRIQTEIIDYGAVNFEVSWRHPEAHSS